MNQEFLNTFINAGQLTDEERNTFANLSNEEKKYVFSKREENRKKNETEKQRQLLLAVYEDTVSRYPVTAEKLRLSKETCDNPETFYKSFNTKTNQRLNELMICAYHSPLLSEEQKKFYMDKIYEKNIGLIWNTVSKYSSKNDGKMTLDDFGQESMIAFVKAVNKFDITRPNKFSTFVVTVVKNQILTIYKSVNKVRYIETSMEDPIADDGGSVKTRLDYQADPNETPEEIVMKESRNKIIYEVLNQLSLEQKFVAYCRFGLGGVPKKTQAEIAQYMHMSQANVSKIENAMLKNMKKALYKEGAL